MSSGIYSARDWPGTVGSTLRIALSPPLYAVSADYQPDTPLSFETLDVTVTGYDIKRDQLHLRLEVGSKRRDVVCDALLLSFYERDGTLLKRLVDLWEQGAGVAVPPPTPPTAPKPARREVDRFCARRIVKRGS